MTPVPQNITVRYKPLVEALAVAGLIVPPGRFEMFPYWTIYL